MDDLEAAVDGLLELYLSGSSTLANSMKRPV